MEGQHSPPHPPPKAHAKGARRSPNPGNVTPNGPHPQPEARLEVTHEMLSPPPGPLLQPYRICPPRPPRHCRPVEMPPPALAEEQRRRQREKETARRCPAGIPTGTATRGQRGPSAPPGPGSAFAGLGLGGTGTPRIGVRLQPLRAPPGNAPPLLLKPRPSPDRPRPRIPLAAVTGHAP